MITHLCPVCGLRHPVNAIRASFAYGRQLACSASCEHERRKRALREPATAPAPAPVEIWAAARTRADLLRVAGALSAARIPARA